MQKTSALTTDVNYVMIHNRTNSLAKVRTEAGVYPEDLALLIDTSPQAILEMESGKRNLTPTVIDMYHLLFGATLNVLLEDLCADLHAYLIERSTELISNLKGTTSPKSRHIVQRLSRLVKLLDIQDNVCPN